MKNQTAIMKDDAALIAGQQGCRVVISSCLTIDVAGRYTHDKEHPLQTELSEMTIHSVLR